MIGRQLVEKIQPPQNRTFVFPFDIALEILKYLEIKDLLMLSLVSKETKELADNNRLWFGLYASAAHKGELKFNDSLNYKEQCRYRELREVGEKIEEIKESYRHSNQQRIALINFLILLKNEPSINAAALKGALFFALKFIQEEYRVACRRAGFAMMYNPPRHSELAKLVSKALNKISREKSDEDYLNAFSRFITETPDTFFEGQPWNKKELISVLKKTRFIESENMIPESDRHQDIYISLLGKGSR